MAKKIGEIAIEQKWITADDVDDVLEIQKHMRASGVKNKKSLFGQILIREGLISAAVVAKLVAEQKNSFVAKFQNLIENHVAFTFGEYHVENFLSRGGMGLIYLVTSKKFTQPLAMKIVHFDAILQKTHERFHNEIKMLASIHHPNIVSILDYGQVEGINFLVMEYLEGQTLNLALKKFTTISQWLQPFCELLGAVEKMHDLGICHCDLKLENIMVMPNGKWVLFDFGLGRFMENPQLVTMGFVGTPCYMAPEQTLLNGQADHRTDIWSLGIILYRLLTKEFPFSEAEHYTLLEQIREKQQQLPQDIPHELIVVCNKALQKEKHQRYQSVADMAKDIAAYCRHARDQVIQPVHSLQKKASFYRQEQCLCQHSIDIEISSQVEFVRITCRQCGKTYLHKIKDYTIQKYIAPGSIGDIYLAVNSRQQQVMIKIIAKTDDFVSDYFKRECIVQKQLHHKNIVQLLDYGDWENYCYIVHEYFPGKTLASIISKYGALPQREAIKITITILKTVRYASNHNIVHRNLHPKNIYLTDKNTVKLLDLGVAKIVDRSYGLSNSGKVAGNAYFMSPEQLRDDAHIDFRSDIYSVGAILYESLRGKPPFANVKIIDLLDAKNKGITIESDHIPTRLCKIIQKAMHADVDERYQCIENMANDLYSVYRSQKA